MALRTIECIVPSAAEEPAFEAIEDLKVLETCSWPISEDRIVLQLLVASDEAEAAITSLQKRVGHHAAFRLLLRTVEATLPVPEEPEPADTTDATNAEDVEPEPEPPERVACMELVASMSEGIKPNRTFFLTVVLSTVVAAAGLMRDNVAVVIGAMVIAPLLTPNMALALATTLGDRQLAGRSARANVSGLAVALSLSLLAGVVVPFDASVGEIATRANVTLGDVVLALAAGAAGALAFTSGISAALVGVMVAVALLPPLVVGGLLVGSGELLLGSKALLLLLVNIICVNLAGIATFLYQGIRPAVYWQERRAKRTVRLALTLWASLLALLGVLVWALERML
jgi:uncharacterized hydrophobic protein (TIGR00341 family)